MHNIVTTVFMVLVLFLAGCGGGGSNSSKTNNSDRLVELSSTRGSSVTINGSAGDALTLKIPPLKSGMKELNVTISLAYNGDLPEIVIDRDVNFTAPVTLTFTSSQLVEGNTTLVYRAPDKTYYIPSVIDDHNTLHATLQHFSKYAFDNLPTPSSALHEDIDSRLAALKAKAENSRISELGYDTLNDLFVKISVYENDGDFSVMLNDLSYIIEKASDNTLRYYEKTQLDFFSGMCPTDILSHAMHELSLVYSFNDTLNEKYGFKLGEGDLAPFLAQDAKIAFDKVRKESKKAWQRIPLPRCGNPELHTYIKCTRNYIGTVEMGIIYFPEAATVGMGNDIEGEMQIMIEQDVEIALDDGDCDCMLFYKNILNTYFAKDFASTISRLDSATQQCGTRCPLLWDITEDINGWYDWNPDFAASGHAEFKNVYIKQRDDAWVDLPTAQREACAPYKNQSSIPASVWSGEYYDNGDGTPPEFEPSSLYLYTPGVDMTQDDFNTFTIGDNSSMPTPQIPFLVDDYTEVDLYPHLNNFQTFTVSATQHGTISYTFTPHVPGFKYPKQ